MSTPQIFYRTTVVDGLNIAYREAGTPDSPKLVLLHGFPASSHQYRNLIPAQATSFHVIAPDYPGFGNSDMPDPAEFAYTFDKLSEVTETFLSDRGFDHYGLFVQDYGGPVGFRIITRNAHALDWLIVQNSNAYEVGFTKAWDGFRGALWENRSAENEAALAAFLEHEAIKGIYLYGAKIRNSSALTTGNPISASWTARTRGGCSSTCFTITAPMSNSIRNGRLSSKSDSRRRSSSGARMTSSSRPKVAKHTSRICLTRKCTDWRLGTLR